MSEIPEYPVDELAGNGVSGQVPGRFVISVDAMGGDRGPAAVVAGLVLSADENSEVHFILHGDEAVLGPLLARQPALAGRCELRHAPRIVTMEDKPSQVMRHGQGTSMWSCIESVNSGEATVAVSCGNTAIAEVGDFEFVGFVEGGDIPSDRVDVIVTDGFTGNIALKTGEGTARMIAELLRETLGGSLLSKIGALFSLGALRRLQKRIDPRRVNGGVFLGLNGTVVKSHGSADATGVAAAIRLAFDLAKTGFSARLAARLASASLAGQQTAAKTDSNNGGPT